MKEYTVELYVPVRVLAKVRAESPEEALVALESDHYLKDILNRKFAPFRPQQVELVSLEEDGASVDCVRHAALNPDAEGRSCEWYRRDVYNETPWESQRAYTRFSEAT